MHNEKQHKQSRMNDEGPMAKHMRTDGGIPIMGAKGRSIHGAHTGEMASKHTGPVSRGDGAVTGMKTDSGSDRMKKGKPGDHEENS